MALIGDDCKYFYNQTCNKGPACSFRHVEEARGTDVVCKEWRLGICAKKACPFRHGEPMPCYYESQPGGCTRPDCTFAHKFPRTGPAVGAPQYGLQPPVTVPPNLRPGWVAPHSVGGPLPPGVLHHSWTPPGAPAPHRFLGPRGSAPPFTQFQPGQPAPAAVYTVDQTGDRVLPRVDPVIINLNSEESDQESVKGVSPQKKAPSIVPPAPAKSDNPLDYFLNAKPWVDPRRKRTPSPKRSSPIRSRSRSPESPRQSPRRSLSPARSTSPPGRRRSVSVDRQPRRRQSPGLDRSRSQSPDSRDRRRFARRYSRSPPRRGSRSPSPPRGRPSQADLRSRLKPAPPRRPQLEEVKVSGPKIISTKKDKKEEEQQKPEEQLEKDKDEAEDKDFVKDEVKSLEEIYRERALKSLMEAKRKRILEQKKKRWESVGGKQSESDASVKSDSEKPTDAETNTKDQATEEHSESEDSEADLADDVDVEIDVGEVEEKVEEKAEEALEEIAEEEEANEHTDSRKVKDVSAKSLVSKVKQSDKPSIKSRLGLKRTEPDKKQASRNRVDTNKSRPLSIKDRLGLKFSDDSSAVSQSVRSGVIRLSRSSSDLSSKIRGVRDMGNRQAVRSRDKKLMLVPQITIKNNVDIEQRRAGIKQRLGLLADDDSDDSRKGHRRKNDMDEELLKLLQEEDEDIDEADIKLLTKKEKKRLLKKLLIEHGREEEYELFRKRKKRDRRRDRDVVGKKRTNVHKLLGQPKKDRESEEEAGDHLDSDEEIELAEEDPEQEVEETPEATKEETAPESSNTKENIPSSDDSELAKLSEEQLREKEQKLREALEPKTLEDIRKDRAVKKARGEFDSLRVTSGTGRRILIAEEKEETIPTKANPPVKVTFGDEDTLAQRKIVQRPSVWSNRDKQDRGSKRERQIYIPPSAKKSGTEEPVIVTKPTLKRVPGPPPGRDIVDYGEVFIKKPSPQTDPAEEPRAKTIKLTRPTGPVAEKRPVLQLNRGPPKVEIKDATVKTFAEIMAEKRRKRQMAQQANNPDRKPFTPITFDEPDVSSQDSASSFVGDKSSTTLKSRLSPVDDVSSNDSNSQAFKLESTSSSPIKRKLAPSPVNAASHVKSSTVETATVKPTRWKRRKTNPDLTAEASLSEQSKVPESQETETTVSVLESKETEPTVSKDSSSVQKPLQYVEQEKAVKRQPSVEKPVALAPAKAQLESSASEKKQKLSDSFLDLDDDFLNMDDDDLDLDLADNQDHDELMKEIDELLA